MLVAAQAGGSPLTRAQIAEAAHCCTQTVKRAMPVLVDLGVLTVHNRFCKNGRQLPNSYYVTAKGKRSVARFVDARGGPEAAYSCMALPGP